MAGAALVTGATEADEGSVLGEAGGTLGTRRRHTLVHLWARTHTLGYTHTRAHTHTHTRMHTQTDRCTHTHIHTNAQSHKMCLVAPEVN